MKGEVELFPNDKIDVSGFDFDDKHINEEREHKVTRRKQRDLFGKQTCLSQNGMGGL